MKEKTLKKFLKQTHACQDGFEFAKDLTLKQFLKTCPRGDWILWLFVRTNPESLRELTLAKAHCAATVKHLMKDKRSLKALEISERFGNNDATRDELDAAAAAAAAAAADAYTAAYAYAYADAYAADAYAYAYADAYAAAYAAAAAAAYAAAAAAADAYAAAAARKANQKLTADICRKYLPLKIWDQSKL